MWSILNFIFEGVVRLDRYIEFESDFGWIFVWSDFEFHI